MPKPETARQMPSKHGSILGPSPLCFVCLSDKPKLRAIGGGHEILCDDCFGAMFTTKGCNGDA